MWSLLVRNVHRIAFVLFAAIFVLLLINVFAAADRDVDRRSESPAAVDGVDRPRDPVDLEPGQAGLMLAGFGLLAGWAVIGVFIGSKPARRRAAAANKRKA